MIAVGAHRVDSAEYFVVGMGDVGIVRTLTGGASSWNMFDGWRHEEKHDSTQARADRRLDDIVRQLDLHTKRWTRGGQLRRWKSRWT
jgi:hypothetical protein